MVALLVALGLCFLVGTSPRLPILVPIAVSFLAILFHLWQTNDHAALSAGLFVGAIAGLMYRLGQRLAARSRADRSVSLRSGMTTASPLQLPLRAAPLLLAAFLIAQDRALARRDGEQPIPVLLPYEGTFQPGQVPEHVILRESDHQLLRELGQTRLPADTGSLILTGAVHRVARSGDREISLVSELELRSTSAAPATWKVPITGAYDITADLDGRKVPVLIEAGGEQAAISIPGAGSFKLQVRRTAQRVVADRHEESLEFPVNPMPAARLMMDRQSRLSRPRLMNARGKLTAAGDRVVGC